MCGIIGQLAFGEFSEDKEEIRKEAMIFFGSELLQLTQERGNDATGAALLFDDGNYIGLKMGISPVDFITRFGKNDKEYGGFIKVWKKSTKLARVFLGHCRKTSVGSSLDNNNNHPIKVGDIVGIHNGTLTNDDVVFEKLKCKRDGMVDSEAIFRLLHHYTENGTNPFTLDMLEKVVERLTGSYAVLSFSGNNPYQVCAFRDLRPVELCLIKPLGLVLIASDKKFFDTLFFRYNKHVNYYIEHRLPILKKGDVEFKSLPDDSALIFDLRTTIKKDTELGDLYDFRKMPRTKLWRKTSSGFRLGANQSNWEKQKAEDKRKKEEEKKKERIESANKSVSKPDGNDKQSKPAGRIWNKMLNGFEPEDVNDVEKSKKIGNVEIDLDTGGTIELGDDKFWSDGSHKLGSNVKKDKFALEEKNRNNEEDVLTEKAEIEEMTTKPHDFWPDGSHSLNKGDIKTVEVEMFVDPEALEKAEESAKEQEQYENEVEVAEALEIEGIKSINSIPVTALANRIKRYIFKRAFYRGYVTAKGNTKTNDKINAAERNIRVLKTIIKIFARAIKFGGFKLRDSMEKAINELLDKKESISVEDLEKVIKPGDLRENQFLGEMKIMMASKEKR